MICLNCKHMECMDYIRGTGICAVLEGETVILDEECIATKEEIAAVESLLREKARLMKENNGVWWL